MTQFLPPNLLTLFAARDPIPYLPPVCKLSHEKPTSGYTGISEYVRLFEDPKDTPLPTKYETKDEKLERRRKEKQEQVAYKLEQEIAHWNPNDYERCTGDPFKTLFVGRINYDTSESKLKREFESYGPIRKIYLVNTKKAGKPRGYAFVEYEHERDMHSAYKHADGKKIDGRRVLVDVERGRTVKGWLPRRLGGGLGGTRRGGPEVNVKMSGREFMDSDFDRRINRDGRDRSINRDRSIDRSRDRSREKDRFIRRDGGRDRPDRVERDRERPRERDREKRRKRSHSKEKDRGDGSKDRSESRRHRSKSKSRDRERAISKDKDDKDKRRERKRRREDENGKDKHDRDRSRDRGRGEDRDREKKKKKKRHDRSPNANKYDEYDQDGMTKIKNEKDEGSPGEEKPDRILIKEEKPDDDYENWGGVTIKTEPRENSEEREYINNKY